MSSDSANNTIVVDSFSPWERRLEKHGWPTLLLCIVFFVGWRSSDYLIPKLDKGFDKHFEFIDNATKTLEKQAENGTVLATQQTKITDILDRQERRTEEMADKIKEVHKTIVKQN